MSSSCRFAVSAVLAVLMEGVRHHHRMPLEVLFSMFITPTHKTAQTARTAKRQERSVVADRGKGRALGMLDGGHRFFLDRRGSAADA
jgi:hypothetical protein